MSLKRGWITDLSPTLRVVIDDRGTIILIRHGSEVFTVNASEARKLEQAFASTKAAA